MRLARPGISDCDWGSMQHLVQWAEATREAGTVWALWQAVAQGVLRHCAARHGMI